MLTAKDKIKDLLGAFILWVLMLWEDIIDIVKTVVITFIVCLLVSTYLFKPVVVNGTSMFPTVTDGSLGFSSIIARNTSGIQRFDIVVINVEAQEKLLIKRVVGLPGETLEFIDGNLFIDGVQYSEDFLDPEYVADQIASRGGSVFTRDFSITLGDDEYFCMGDNRMVSADSRVYGPFSGRDILSCGIFVFYPFSNFGLKH